MYKRAEKIWKSCPCTEFGSKKKPNLLIQVGPVVQHAEECLDKGRRHLDHLKRRKVICVMIRLLIRGTSAVMVCDVISLRAAGTDVAYLRKLSSELIVREHVKTADARRVCRTKLHLSDSVNGPA